MADKIEAQALAEKCEVAAHYLTFPFMAPSIKEQHEAAAVLRECAEAIKAADTEINALRTLLGDAAEKLTQTESARALARGEPGEAFGTYVEYSDGTTAFRKRGEPFAPTVLGGTVWTLYLSPTASAPAAEREPQGWPITWEVSWGELDEDDECSPCGWRVHDRRGSRNDREWTLIATGSTPDEAIRAAHGIGTKEPSNG